MAALILSLLSLALLPAAALALPDGREYEQVTPPNKHGADPRPIGEGFQAPKGGLIAAATSGNALTYVADSPVETEPEGNRSGEGNQIMAVRSEAPAAWSSKDIVTPHNQGEGFITGEPQEYRLFSPDLNFAAVTPFGLQNNPLAEPPLVGGVSSEERSIYRRNNTACQAKAANCFEALVNKQNVTTSTAYGDKLEYLGANPTISAVVFNSPEPLTAAEAPEGGLYESDTSKPPAEQLQLVDVLPNGTTAAEPAEPAFGGINPEDNIGLTRDAVSEDASRVFFTERVVPNPNKEVAFRELFMRDTVSHVTVRIDAAEEGAKEVISNNRRVHFQGASADGSRIFFTSNAPLTADSHVAPKEGGADNLYVCEIPTTTPVTEATKCKLHDLTGTLFLGKNAGVGDVLGMVSAISEEGNTVYFAANATPVEEREALKKCPDPASAGTVTPSSSQHCYMYVAHLEGETWEPAKLIATMSGFDSPAWAGGGTDQGELVARTSPKGRYFAFMSEEPLTGYDNRDLNPTAETEKKRDEEVFLYDREAPEPAKALTCVSCNPNPNQRPRGIYDKEDAGEGFGPRVDPWHYVWNEHWLAGSIPAWTPVNLHKAPYQSRFLLDSGRLYFNSSDSLVPHSVETRPEPGISEEVGVENVYQYEPEKEGTCEAGSGGCVSLISSGTSQSESAFLDASVSGNDVFFLTAASLVPSDVDTSFDVYDARVCGSTGCIKPPEPPPRPCSDEATCRNGGPSTPPSFGPAPSSTYSGPGNTPKTEVLGSKSSKPPRKLTNAQKLAKALASCRKKYKHSRGKRMSCEKQARKLYAKHASVKHKKGKK